MTADSNNCRQILATGVKNNGRVLAKKLALPVMSEVINKTQLIYLIFEINDNIHVATFPMHEININIINNMKIFLIIGKFI
jgi:hypothetical protein